MLELQYTKTCNYHGMIKCTTSPEITITFLHWVLTDSQTNLNSVFPVFQFGNQVNSSFFFCDVASRETACRMAGLSINLDQAELLDAAQGSQRKTLPTVYIVVLNDKNHWTETCLCPLHYFVQHDLIYMNLNYTTWPAKVIKCPSTYAILSFLTINAKLAAFVTLHLQNISCRSQRKVVGSEFSVWSCIFSLC